MVLELDANIVGAFNQDVMSAPDTSGRRWIQLSFMKGRFGEKDLSKYSKGLQDLVGRLLKKYLPQAYEVAPTSQKPPKRMQKGRYYIHWMNLGIFAAQQKGKKYLDGVEDIYKRNANHLRGLMTDYLNLRRTEESWDEIIANDFTIKKVFGIDDSSNWSDTEDAYGQNEFDAFRDEVRIEDKLKFQPISRNDLEQYIRDVAKKDAGEVKKKSNPADDLAKRQAEVLKAIGKK